MKALSRPMSSPSRTDKFPTPLMMRFLRSNVGSKSRGRSRSSPMFIVRNNTKKNNSSASINESQQEPTSPKVTCIGQVRARRSSSKTTSGQAAGKSKKSFSCIKQPHQYSCCYCSCHDSKRFNFSQRFSSSFHKPRSFCTSFRKWGWFFRFGYCKKMDTREDSSRFQSVQSRKENQFGSVGSGSECEDVEVFDKMSKLIQETKDLGIESSTPPKNAFLLTRCRSAPYRSSSLAVRFWGSPLRNSETEKIDTEEQEESSKEGKKMLILTKLETEKVESSRNSHENSKETDDCCNERPKEEKIQEFRTNEGVQIHPLLLMRCKSEPAKTGERLNPETNFWKQRRGKEITGRVWGAFGSQEMIGDEGRRPREEGYSYLPGCERERRR